MARIVVYTATIATDASNSTHVNLGEGEFQRFAIAFPSTNPLNAACDITTQMSVDGGTNWNTISYSNSPATATSDQVNWSAPQDAWGNTIICESALFATDFRVKFACAATQAGEVYVIAGKD